MGNYCMVRLWQLKPGCSAVELETLTSTGILEMQRWMPGVRHISLVRLKEEAEGRYLFMITFASGEAYRKWRQVEAEGPDYWERYASVLVHWEQLSALVEEYAGDTVLDAEIDNAVRGDV